MIEFDIANRKYLGSKARLLPFLMETMLRQTKGRLGVFADIFSGTGVVGNTARKTRGCDKVISNDFLYSNYVANKCYLQPQNGSVKKELVERLQSLASAEPLWGYVFQHYGNRYFSWDNSAAIDGIREALVAEKQNMSDWVYYACLSSLLYAADRAANTVGQYDAYLKNVSSSPYKDGVHVVDENVLKPLRLGVPLLEAGAPAEVYCEDANDLIGKIECDTLYIDPPYNSRQYSDLYHVLENIARWEKPELKGKTQKFNRDAIKSKYSRKTAAETAFKELILAAKCKHIFVSYNNEGLLSKDAIILALANRGRPELFTQEYPVFGGGAGRALKRNVVEYLFYVYSGK